MDEIVVYTDGACSGNPGMGAWAWIQVKENKVCAELSGFLGETTNNVAELTAILSACSSFKDCILKVFTDSLNACNWLNGDWERRDSKIIHLCCEIERAVTINNIQLELNWVKGHSKNKFNDDVDELAVRCRKINSGL